MPTQVAPKGWAGRPPRPSQVPSPPPASESANRVIAELEMSSSPEAAVRHALDEVSEETRELLQRAHQTAEDITARSRSKADDRLQDAEREAQSVRVEAAEEAAQTRELAM